MAKVTLLTIICVLTLSLMLPPCDAFAMPFHTVPEGKKFFSLKQNRLSIPAARAQPQRISLPASNPYMPIAKATSTAPKKESSHLSGNSSQQLLSLFSEER